MIISRFHSAARNEGLEQRDVTDCSAPDLPPRLGKFRKMFHFALKPFCGRDLAALKDVARYVPPGWNLPRSGPVRCTRIAVPNSQPELILRGPVTGWLQGSRGRPVYNRPRMIGAFFLGGRP
jgi:hypothetical protein